MSLQPSSFYSDYFFSSITRPYRNNRSTTSSGGSGSGKKLKLNSSVHQYLCQKNYLKCNQHYEQVFKSKYLNELVTSTMDYSNKYKITSVHHHDINGMSINNNYLLSCGSDRMIGLYNYNEFLSNDFDVQTSDNSYISRFDRNDNNFKTILKSCHTIRRRDSPHQSTISNIKWYPYDNGMFFTSSFDASLIVWDTQSMSNVMSFDCMSKIYSFDMYGGNKLDPNQNVIACALDDHSIKLCDLNSGACVQQFIGHSDKVNCVQFSPNSDYLLASASDDLTIRLWDIRTSGWLLCMDQFNIHSSTKNTDSVDLFKQFGNVSNSEKVKNRLNKRKQQDLGFSTGKSYNYNIKVPTAHNQSINCIKFSNCGQYLYSTGNDNKLMKWVVSNGYNTQYNCNVVNRNKGSCQIIAETDGDVLFHSSFNRVDLFDKHDGKSITTLSEIHYDSIRSMCFDSVNQFLFTAGYDHFIEVWDTNLNTIYEDPEDMVKNKSSVNIQRIQDQDDWDD